MRYLLIHKRKIITILLILASFILMSLFIRDTSSRSRFKEYSSIVMAPYLSEEYNEQNHGILQENGYDYNNYWMTTSGILSSYYKTGVITSELEEVFERLMDTWYRYGSFPRPAYENLEYGWVSCMDAPVIGVTSIVFYEETKDPKYLNFLYDLIPYLSSTVEEGGYALMVEGRPWLLEYAWRACTPNDVMFVLNGSLLGTLSTAIIADYTQNRNLKKLVDEQTALYKEYLPQFNYRDNEWYYYMLNPKAVNQTHYVIFEMKLFDALAEVCKSDYYRQCAEERRKTFEQVLKVYAIKSNSKTLHFSFMRNCAPHTYYIDMYPTKLEFYNIQNTLIHTFEADTNNISTDGFLEGDISSDATYVKVLSYGYSGYTLLATVPIELLESNSLIPITTTYTISTSHNAQQTENHIEFIDNLSDATYGIIYFDIAEILPFGSQYYYGIEVENLSSSSLYSTITFIDSNDNVISRYLIPIEQGKVFVLLNTLGFIEGEYPLQDVAQMRLRIFTDTLEPNTSTMIKVENIYLFDNTLSINNFLSQSDYLIQQQIKRK